jgi:CBS domain-containing protein
MRTWSIPIGRFYGVEFRLHLMFVFLLMFVLLTDSVLLLGPGKATTAATAAAMARGVTVVLMVVLCVLLHELAHMLAAHRRRAPVRSVVLLPLGGVTLLDDSTPHDEKLDLSLEMRLAAIGPLVNLAFALAGILVAFALGAENGLLQTPLLHSGDLLRSFVWINLIIAGLNVLPAYPLDGGRILRAQLARSMSVARASRWAVMIGQLFAMVLVFVGIWNPWFMMAGMFLFVAGQLEERTMMFRAVLESVSLEEVMLTAFATLSPADTLEDALQKSVHTLQDDFPVIDRGDMVGVISRQRIVHALRYGGNAYVQAVMAQSYDVAAKTESLASALRKITRRGLTIIPVVENDRLIGIVTLQNLMHSMALLAESRKLKRAAAEE